MTRGEIRGLLTKINELWPGRINVTDKMVDAWLAEFQEIPVGTVRRSFKRFMDDPRESGDFPPSPKKLRNHAPQEDLTWRKTQAYWDRKYAEDPAYRAMKDEYKRQWPARFITIDAAGDLHYSNERREQ